MPPIRNREQKDACAREFKLYCETYFPNAFPLAWSADHLKILDAIQRAVLTGGLFALAMPRGSGKTTLCERAVMWAVSYGHHRFAMLICADEGKAVSCLTKIQTEFETNELLFADFPEICYPVRCLERIANRAKGQLLNGEPTRMEWGKDRVILPAVPGSRASGGVIFVGGITSAVRGAAINDHEGFVLRPSLALIDDPQTRESASSPLQNHTREQIISADILGCSGPGKPFSALMPCTVIRRGDAADRLLNRTLHPDWQGERCKLLYAFPSRIDLWEEYWTIRSDSLRHGGTGATATEFYRANRDIMDLGAEVAWPERHRPDELSALQNCMNLWFRDQEAFLSEYQNAPLDDSGEEEALLSSDEIATKVNGLARLKLPLGTSHVTAFVDVQKTLLWYCVCAWEDDFTGAVVEYGAWPEQQRNYYTLSDAHPTLQDKFPKLGLEGVLHAGLTHLIGMLAGTVWQREDKAELRIERCLVDANWGDSTELVYEFCRRSPHAGLLLPSHGRGVKASDMPFSEYKRRKGERLGQYWRLPSVAGKRASRYVLFDTNYWKSFVHARLGVALGDRGCLSLFEAKHHVHRMFAEHVTAEYRVKNEAKGRTVHEWKLRPGRDNHLFDGLVGCAVAASIQGCQLEAAGPKPKPEAPSRPRKRVHYC